MMYLIKHLLDRCQSIPYFRWTSKASKGKTSKKLPPPKITNSTPPKAQPGMEYATKIKALELKSNIDPCERAFFIPRGIQTSRIILCLLIQKKEKF